MLTGVDLATEGVDRFQLIVNTSAKLFSEKGFDRTSIRDIASAAGLLPGSLYYYFKSKEEIFLEVHSQGMKILSDAAREAIAPHKDPWCKLEALAVAHSQVLLDDSGFMFMVAARFPECIAEQNQILMKQRDEYEAIIAEVIGELDLAADIDSDVFRLQFLGALNWAQTWYRKDRGMAPKDIGKHLVKILCSAHNGTVREK